MRTILRLVIVSIITKRFLAEINLTGIAIGAVGGLYLAYDLLGGKNGPLRTIARATGYAFFFFVSYTLLLGIKYALIASFGMGVILAVEFRGAAAKKNGDSNKTRRKVIIFGFLRGLVLGLAAFSIGGISFGLLFGGFSGTVLSVQYIFGFSPSNDYKVHVKPRISKHNLLASGLRALGISAAGISAGFITKPDDNWLALGIRLGIGAGFVSAVIGQLSPSVEWWVDGLEDRVLGLFGLVLVFLGMLLQATDPLLTIFNVAIK